MNSHLTDEQLIGYVHHTLTDAQREAMDQHLTVCPDCRTRLSEHEALQRYIRHSLMADLKGGQPSPALSFSGIAPRLKRPNRLARLWQQGRQLVPSATVLTALAGLVMAAIGLIKGIHQPVVGLARPPASSLPTVACFLFVIPAVSGYYGSRTVPLRLILSRALALLLWLGTAIMGLQVIVVLRNFFIWVLLQVMSDLWSAIGMGNWAIVPLGIAWIALVVGGGEFHYSQVGQRSSWRLFAWTIAVELLIVSLPYLL